MSKKNKPIYSVILFSFIRSFIVKWGYRKKMHHRSHWRLRSYRWCKCLCINDHILMLSMSTTDEKIVMVHSLVQLDDLPDEILLIILRRLDNDQVLYSLYWKEGYASSRYYKKNELMFVCSFVCSFVRVFVRSCSWGYCMNKYW